ncbi:MAG TPA: hypothetical protein VKR26_19235, partial [Terriglobales bacterium]|nr:hypothetical protein [Terriglobales bacterium]
PLRMIPPGSPIELAKAVADTERTIAATITFQLFITETSPTSVSFNLHSTSREAECNALYFFPSVRYLQRALRKNHRSPRDQVQFLAAIGTVFCRSLTN